MRFRYGAVQATDAPSDQDGGKMEIPNHGKFTSKYLLPVFQSIKAAIQRTAKNMTKIE